MEEWRGGRRETGGGGWEGKEMERREGFAPTVIFKSRQLWCPCDHATKFARWQHPAVGHGVRFTVRCTI